MSDELEKQETDQEKAVSRRRFVSAAATSAVAAAAGTALLASCTDDETGDDTTVDEVLPPTEPSQSVRWGMFLDLGKCVGCKSCVVACKAEHQVPLGVFRREVKELEVGVYPNTERRYLPWLCNHCDDPPCIDRCPTEPECVTQTFPNGEEIPYFKRATYKRPDGLVLVDDARCIGCGNCVVDCPYGARFLNPDKPAAASELPEAGPLVADKCDHCVSRVEGGVVPACVQTCPAEALVFGNIADPASEISQLIASTQATPLIDSYATTPLSRYTGFDAVSVDDIFISGRDVKDERCALESDDSCRSGA